MNKFNLIFRILFLVSLGSLSIKMMYSDSIDEPLISMEPKPIEYAECPSGKYAHPFFRVEGSETKFHVIKEFTYRTGCANNQEGVLLGKTVSFDYFKDSPTSGKVVEISLGSDKIYTQKEFIGKTTASGAILFISVLAFGVWCFYSAKRHNKPL